MKSFNQIMAPLVELVYAKTESLKRPNLSDFARQKIEEEAKVLSEVYDELEKREQRLLEANQELSGMLVLKELTVGMLQAENMQLLKQNFDMDNRVGHYFMEWLKQQGSMLASQMKEYHRTQTIKKQLLQ